MRTIFELKEQAITDTPLLVFDCVLANGQTERWSTHGVEIDEHTYDARVTDHNIFEIQTASGQGVDGIPRISIVLANADSHFSELERTAGWKGAKLTVGFLFYDLRNGVPASERSVIFQGVCNPPDEIRESTFRITATNRMNLQRLLLPQVRIQRRCPWEFPATATQKAESPDKYSRFHRCGYSGEEFSSCGYTRRDCEARGLFPRFGGIEFMPPAIAVRSYGDKSYHTSAVSVNAARYNDFVPLVYGTVWYQPPVVFARNDGNLTRMEVLLGLGEMEGVLKVLVNDVEVPAGVPGENMTATGWYNTPTLGTRDGTVDPDFPEGDPYGSMAYLAIAVPNRLNDGTSLPRVKVLAQGLKLPTNDGERFTNNPAWILLDILRRTGWEADEIDADSFAEAAAICNEPIDAGDIYGNPISLPRFGCNLALQNRRSAGDIVRGVRNAGRLLLTYGMSGKLQVRVENAVAAEQAVRPEWSNASESWNGGWPSYEFGEREILRRSNGEPSVRLFAKSMADTPNRFTVEFQDALNEYQQDSFSLVDPDDVATSGQEVAAALPAIGLPNYDQAARILKLSLDKSIRGNTYIEFDTSVKAFGVRPGDLITVTYLKEGFERQGFRILKIAPGANHRITTITAQIHDDSWYADSNGQTGSGPGGRRPGIAGIGVPRPLIGSELDVNGDIQFGVQGSAESSGDGSSEVDVTVSFVLPAIAAGAGPGIPMVSLAPHVAEGGALRGGQILYYAISAVNEADSESGLSFIVRAQVVADESSVTLQNLSFAPGTVKFHVYRGSSPGQMFRIASDQPVATLFTDTGMEKQLVAPPDCNFDHANFYWRMELQPEAAATLHSANSIGNDTLQMTENRYRGMIARITRGRGAGEERQIAANTATRLTVSPAWSLQPDATSVFVVAENGWRFGALAQSSPVRFSFPDRAGETVHLTGRAANVNDVECSGELSIVTRWQIGGGGTSDGGVPPQPFFGVSAGGRGTVVLSGVSFTDLANTHSISAGTLTLYYWDELQNAPPATLVDGFGDSDEVVCLTPSGSAALGAILQIGREVVRVDEVLDGGAGYRLARAVHGSMTESHAAGDAVYRLTSRTDIAPFPPEFFGSPYSGSWSFPISLPDVRVVSSELFVTNRGGNSPVRGITLTHNQDKGLRTLSGGQYSIQVSGYLAVEQSAAPPLVVETSRSVRDVYAVLGKAADAQVQIQLKVSDEPYCTVTFLAGMTVSDAVDGNTLGPLLAGSQVSLAVLSVGSNNPGADLTVLIRL